MNRHGPPPLARPRVASRAGAARCVWLGLLALSPVAACGRDAPKPASGLVLPLPADLPDTAGEGRGRTSVDTGGRGPGEADAGRLDLGAPDVAPGDAGCLQPDVLSSAPPAITRVWLSFDEDPATTMVISWLLDTARGAAVRYGPICGPMDNVAKSPAPAAHHAVHLEGLEPATRYRYVITDDQGQRSAVHGFFTAPAAGASAVPTTFAALGDSRAAVDGGVASGFSDVLLTLRAVAPELRMVAFTGDMIDWGSAPGMKRWRAWLDEVATISADHPLLSAIGNHEYYSGYGAAGDATRYENLFVLPQSDSGGELWYAFDYGDTHHTVLSDLSSPTGVSDLSPGSPQHAFILKDLAAAADNPKVKWRVVHMHEPLYSSVAGKTHVEARKILVPIFEQYGVDVVLTGHAHGYERTKRLLGGEESPDKGVYYVVTAGAGAPLAAFDADHPFTAKKAQTHGFVLITTGGSKLSFRAHAHPGGAQIDGFVIVK